MKVLIADDSELMRERIRESISIFESIEILSESDRGHKTLEELLRHNPDLAIIDIRMPDMSGLEVIKQYRKTNKISKIIILTNYAYDQYRDKAIENGADYFLSKSEDFDKITLIVASIIRDGEIVS